MTSNQKVTISTRFKNLVNRIKSQFSTKQKKKVFFDKVKKVIIDIIKYIFLIGLSFVILYPLLLQLSIAFREPTDINNPTVLWIPEKFSIKNFEISIIALHYWEALKNSFFNSTLVMIFQVLSTALAGYAFARLQFKGSKILFALALFTIIVPQTMVSLPMYRSFSESGMLGKKYILFLMAALGMGIKSGIFIYLFRQFFKGLPIELEEAAYVDGANVFQVFFRVMLPNARGCIITVALLSFVWQWNDYYFTNLFYVNGQVDVFTLATQHQSIIYGLVEAVKTADVWQLMGQEITSNPLFVSMILNTAGILVMLPVLIIYFFAQKLFVEGIERSGIVG